MGTLGNDGFINCLPNNTRQIFKLDPNDIGEDLGGENMKYQYQVSVTGSDGIVYD